MLIKLVKLLFVSVILLTAFCGCNNTPKYEGDLEKGVPHGQGILTYSSGIQYTGEFKNGVFHGYGIWTHPDGFTYEGEWMNGMKHGLGTLLFSDGKNYTGQWENNLKHGKGRYVWLDGSEYYGDWENDMRHGHGEMFFANGKRYVGRWQNDRIYTEPLMVVSFDDGFRTDYTVAYKEMLIRGIRGTSYITTGYVGTPWGREWLTWPQVKEMHSNGWDIQCHTHTHPDLTGLSEDEIVSEMIKVNDIFELHGLDMPDHHAYPFVKQTMFVRSIVSQHRKTMRGDLGGFKIESYLDIDLTQMPHLGGDGRIRDHFGLEEIFSYINETIGKGGIFHIYFHEIPEQNLDNFTSMLDYAIESGIKIVTVSELYDIIQTSRGY